ILIEGNTITDPGLNGDQGDGIDLKWGLMNVTVRNNVISNTHTMAGDSGGNGIVTLGSVAPAPTNYVIEDNRIFGCASNGILLSGNSGTVVRNNLIYDNGVQGIRGTGITTAACNYVEIYSNTIYGNLGGGLVFNDPTTQLTFKNNLIFGNAGSYQAAAYT